MRTRDEVQPVGLVELPWRWKAWVTDWWSKNLRQDQGQVRWKTKRVWNMLKPFEPRSRWAMTNCCFNQNLCACGSLPKRIQKAHWFVSLALCKLDGFFTFGTFSSSTFHPWATLDEYLINKEVLTHQFGRQESLRHPVQRCIQRHVVRRPTPIDHQDRSKVNRTWHLRGAPALCESEKNNTQKKHLKSWRQICLVYWRPCRMVLIIRSQKKGYNASPRHSQ